MVASAFCWMSPALATDYVTQSNLTGFELPGGALELTNADFPEELVELIENVASGMNGKCEYHEMLFWEAGNIDSLIEALDARIPTNFKFNLIDGTAEKDFNYVEFSLKSTNVWYAAVWMDSADGVVLGWCNVVKK